MHTVVQVRVGGKGKSERLEAYNLFNIGEQVNPLEQPSAQQGTHMGHFTGFMSRMLHPPALRP